MQLADSVKKRENRGFLLYLQAACTAIIYARPEYCTSLYVYAHWTLILARAGIVSALALQDGVSNSRQSPGDTAAITVDETRLEE